MYLTPQEKKTRTLKRVIIVLAVACVLLIAWLVFIYSTYMFVPKPQLNL